MSPAIQDYHIYCDETFLRGNVAFAFGALICTPRRAAILKHEFVQARKNLDYYGELKWKEVRSRTLPICEQFVNLFLEDPFAKFSLMRVVKGQSWNTWGKTEEERFFKAYYVFLKLNAGPFSRYHIYPDMKSLQKTYRWETLHFLINRSRRDEWGLKHRNIRTFRPLDSETNDLLQVTDLILGCLTSVATAEAKVYLQQQVTNRLTTKTVKSGPKLEIRDWTPRKKVNKA